MCGIVGYTGEHNAAGVLLGALERLEYRGYDSAGIAVVEHGSLQVRKDVGKLEEVKASCRFDEMSGTLGVGHVRWATHGAVSKANSHPHQDCSGRVAVVHNGIVENYQELKKSLESSHKFCSQTDTEVIAHLIEERLSGGAKLEEAVRETVKILEGSFALVVISSDEPGKVVAFRNGNPLVIGLGANENFIASDFQAFMNITRKVIFVEDGESIVLNRSKVNLYGADGRKILRAPVLVDPVNTSSGRQGYEHFMHKEIMEQPQVIRQAAMQDKLALKETAGLIAKSKSVVFTACGSSRYAALIGRYLFSQIAHKFSDVVIASEFGYFSESVDSQTLVIAVSQSGETADVIEGVKQAREKGAKVLSIINTVGSTLARMSDKTLYLNCGPEIGVAATKSFLGQLTIFYLLSFAMAGKLDQVLHKLTRIADLIEDNLLLNNIAVPGIAKRLAQDDKFYFIARGINYATAGETALKLKEVAYVHAEGMPAGELKHGTLALIKEKTPVVAICPTDLTHTHMLSNIAEVKARGAWVIGVSDRRNELFDDWIEVIKVDEIFYPLVSVVPLQVFAFYSALARGLDPDKPRNLAKSVTVR